MWKNDESWKAEKPTKHLELLEKELEKKSHDDPMLRTHIRRLKFAWRRGRRFSESVA